MSWSGTWPLSLASVPAIAAASDPPPPTLRRPVMKNVSADEEPLAAIAAATPAASASRAAETHRGDLRKGTKGATTCSGIGSKKCADQSMAKEGTRHITSPMRRHAMLQRFSSTGVNGTAPPRLFSMMRTAIILLLLPLLPLLAEDDAASPPPCMGAAKCSGWAIVASSTDGARIGKTSMFESRDRRCCRGDCPPPPPPIAAAFPPPPRLLFLLPRRLVLTVAVEDSVRSPLLPTSASIALKAVRGGRAPAAAAAAAAAEPSESPLLPTVRWWRAMPVARTLAAAEPSHWCRTKEGGNLSPSPTLQMLTISGAVRTVGPRRPPAPPNIGGAVVLPTAVVEEEEPAAAAEPPPPPPPPRGVSVRAAALWGYCRVITRPPSAWHSATTASTMLYSVLHIIFCSSLK